MDSGLSFDAFSEVFGREDLALAAGKGRARRTGRSSSFRSFWLLESAFHAFTFRGLDSLCSLITFLVFDTHATLSDGK